MKIADLRLFRAGAFLGLVTVVLGAAAAHAIKFDSEELRGLYDMGIFYQAIHVPVIMLLGVLGMRREGWVILGGLGLFCWPLLLKGVTGVSLGPIVPTGGMIMILGWLWTCLATKEGKSASASDKSEEQA
jgi:uncharacterized membrane protein YgdD (TMEM256/DUF423 family)